MSQTKTKARTPTAATALRSRRVDATWSSQTIGLSFCGIVLEPT